MPEIITIKSVDMIHFVLSVGRHDMVVGNYWVCPKPAGAKGLLCPSDHRSSVPMVVSVWQDMTSY